MNSLVKKYHVRYQAIVDEQKSTPLVFRRAARSAFADFSRAQRKLFRNLTTPVTDGVAFYDAWEASRDQFATVAAAGEAKVLLNGLKRHLLLEDEASRALLSTLVVERTQELQGSLLDTLYDRADRKARRAAVSVLEGDEDTFRSAYEAYVKSELYTYVAQEQHMKVYDAQAPLLKRRLQKTREKAQVRRFIRKTERSLHKIERLMTHLELRDDSILASLFALNINLVTIQAAHRRYEKARMKLSEKDQHNPAKQLALYEKEVKAVKTLHLEQLPAAHTLQDIRKAASELDAVLLRIFDMDERSYNELMARMKRYRELVRERAVLSRQLKD